MSIAVRPIIRIKPRCDALTSTYSQDAYNANRLRCNQWIGVTGYTDRDGNERHWCAAPGHARDVMRRYPPAHRCYICGNSIHGDLFGSFDFAKVGIQTVCDTCIERGEE